MNEPIRPENSAATLDFLRVAGIAVIAVVASLLAPETARAYQVESDSIGNRFYISLWNENQNAPVDGLGVSIEMPDFCSAATPIHVPATIPAASARLTGFSFDVDPAAVGVDGFAIVTVSGTVGGNPVSVGFLVPLSVAADAPDAVYVDGLLGNEGGDTDGDGFADSVEIHFGSDPFDLNSIPSETIVVLPALSPEGLAMLIAGLFLVAVAGNRPRALHRHTVSRLRRRSGGR